MVSRLQFSRLYRFADVVSELSRGEECPMSLSVQSRVRKKRVHERRFLQLGGRLEQCLSDNSMNLLTLDLAGIYALVDGLRSSERMEKYLTFSASSKAILPVCHMFVVRPSAGTHAIVIHPDAVFASSVEGSSQISSRTIAYKRELHRYQLDNKYYAAYS